MKWKWGWIVVACIFLTGCATTAKYEAQVQKWIGATERQLVEDWGVPSRTHEMDGIKFFEYKSNEIRLVGGYPSFYGMGPLGRGMWMGGAMPPDVQKLTCVTTFELTDGIVTKVVIRGNNCMATEHENVAAEQKAKS